MAADFIEQDGNIYLRLTGNTTQVSFNSAVDASFNYTFSIAGLQVNNTGTLTHVFDDVNNVNELFNGTGASFVNEVPEDAGGHDVDTSFNVNAKHYTITWNTPFSNANYTPSVTIIDSRTASGYYFGMVFFDVADIQAGSFKVQFQTTTKSPGPQDLGYVRSFSATATAPFYIIKSGGNVYGTGQIITVGGSGIRYYLVTAEGTDGNNTTFQYTTTNQNNFLCLGSTVLQFQNNTIAYPGTPKNKNLFVKSSGNWKPSRNIFVKYQNAWRQCEKVWIKSGGVWKESYVRNSSDWVNMLEGFTDYLDFAVQVVANN